MDEHEAENFTIVHAHQPSAELCNEHCRIVRTLTTLIPNYDDWDCEAE